MISIKPYILLLCLCLALPFSGYAQSGGVMTSVSGRILDTTQAPIAGARVKAVPEGASTGPTTLSDDNGTFSLSLQPGQYSLEVSKEGFADSASRSSSRHRRSVACRAK